MSFDKIETVIFDYGNVLTVWDPFQAVKDKYTEKEFLRFKNDVHLEALIDTWDGGETREQTVERIAFVDRIRGTNWVDLYNHYEDNFAKTLSPLKGMDKLIEDLQAAGIKCYGLSNWSISNIHIAKRDIRAIGLLDGMVISGEEKIIKPNPRIYNTLLDRYNIKAETALFVDDKPVNVEGAEIVGIQGYLNEKPFEETEVRLRKFFKENNVLI
ncbi:MAG: HAD family phosphatase [Candidatus Ancillula sp.]|jgi:putative hydrolase of the HAD superfamily|nr:HAD family phosphatase [Candidatus Ancillula sp.]